MLLWPIKGVTATLARQGSYPCSCDKRTCGSDLDPLPGPISTMVSCLQFRQNSGKFWALVSCSSFSSFPRRHTGHIAQAVPVVTLHTNSFVVFIMDLPPFSLATIALPMRFYSANSIARSGSLNKVLSWISLCAILKIYIITSKILRPLQAAQNRLFAGFYSVVGARTEPDT